MTCIHCGAQTKCAYSRAVDGAYVQDIPNTVRLLLGEKGRWRRYKCTECKGNTDTAEIPLKETT